MDGTLIDSGNVITNTINFVRTNIGLESLEKTTLLTQLNNPNIDASLYFYGTKEFTPQQTKLFNEYYDKHCISDIVLYDGIKELLEKLSTQYTLSVATNAFSNFAIKMLEHLDINQYFSYVVGANMVQNPKPSADMLIKTLDYFDLKSNEAILVGDSHKDKNAAINANMDYILVDWGFSKYDDSSIVKSIVDWKNILQ